MDNTYKYFIVAKGKKEVGGKKKKSSNDHLVEKCQPSIGHRVLVLASLLFSGDMLVTALDNV